MLSNSGFTTRGVGQLRRSRLRHQQSGRGTPAGAMGVMIRFIFAD